MGLRIAVCFSGHIRRFEEVFGNLESNILEPLRQHGSIDFFASTWLKRNTAICHSAFGRNFDRDIVTENIDANSIFKLLAPKDLEIQDFEAIKENFLLSNFTDIPFGPPAAFREGILTTTPAFYKIQRCNDLKKRFEEDHNLKYDLVVRMRFDMLVDNKVEWVVFPNHISTLFIGLDGGLCDHLFYGASDLMNEFCSVFSNLREIFKLNFDRGGERILYYHAHLKAINYIIQKGPCFRRFIKN